MLQWNKNCVKETTLKQEKKNTKPVYAVYGGCDPLDHSFDIIHEEVILLPPLV